LGANDACLPEISTKQGVPLEKYKENLGTLLRHPLIAAHDPKILLAIPPPVDAARCQIVDLEKDVDEVRREAEHTAMFAAGAREVAAKFGSDLAVVDLWKAFMGEALKKTPDHDSSGPMLGSRQLGGNQALIHLLPDGLHMSDAGYRLFFKEVVNALEQHWPDSTPDKLPLVLPAWADAPKQA
jgi:lysophospholipase L1-like esterase